MGYRQADRQAERQTDRQTDRLTDRQADRQSLTANAILEALASTQKDRQTHTHANMQTDRHRNKHTHTHVMMMLTLMMKTCRAGTCLRCSSMLTHTQTHICRQTSRQTDLCKWKPLWRPQACWKCWPPGLFSSWCSRVCHPLPLSTARRETQIVMKKCQAYWITEEENKKSKCSEDLHSNAKLKKKKGVSYVS